LLGGNTRLSGCGSESACGSCFLIRSINHSTSAIMLSKAVVSMNMLMPMMDEDWL
jgi:hypothetical protein